MQMLSERRPTVHVYRCPPFDHVQLGGEPNASQSTLRFAHTTVPFLAPVSSLQTRLFHFVKEMRSDMDERLNKIEKQVQKVSAAAKTKGGSRSSSPGDVEEIDGYEAGDDVVAPVAFEL